MGNSKVTVWKNFPILSPKLILAYAEDILCDSRLKKNVLNANLQVLSILRFGFKKNFFGKKSALSMLYRECGVGS